MPEEITEIRIDEHGSETHESWVLIRANRVSGLGGRARLFDSEIGHQHWIMVEVSSCTRRRDLNHDRLHAEEVILRVDMSEAQWGAFVSSFGQGNGVPATLQWLNGPVAQAPPESRLEKSTADVRESGEKALEGIEQHYATVMEAFESGGRKALREALRSMGYAIENAPKNMEYAAKSLTEHVENVVTKARADIEAMALAANDRAELSQSTSALRQIGSGKEETDV